MAPNTKQPDAKREPRDIKGAIQGIFGLAVIAIILHFAGVVTIPGLNSAVSNLGSAVYSPEAAAINGARQGVLAKLKAPGSAKFPHSVVAAKTADQRFFVVYVVVDSQNQFGAMLRNHALALVSVTGDNISNARKQVMHLEITESSPTIGRIKELTQELGTGWQIERWVNG